MGALKGVVWALAIPAALLLGLAAYPTELLPFTAEALAETALVRGVVAVVLAGAGAEVVVFAAILELVELAAFRGRACGRLVIPTACLLDDEASLSTAPTALASRFPC